MSTNAQHTPGPWKFRQSPQGVNVVTDSTPDAPNGSFIGQIIAYKTTAPNYEANLKLIAAAPELLDALNKLLAAFDMSAERCPTMPIQSIWDTKAEAVRQAQEAIAKATT